MMRKSHGFQKNVAHSAIVSLTSKSPLVTLRYVS